MANLYNLSPKKFFYALILFTLISNISHTDLNAQQKLENPSLPYRECQSILNADKTITDIASDNEAIRDLSSYKNLSIQIHEQDRQKQDRQKSKQIVYASNSDGKLRAADISEDILLWETDLGNEAKSKILSDDKNLYLVSAISKAEVSDKDYAGESSEKRVGSSGSAEIHSEVVDGISSSILRSISKKTGITNWQLELPVSSKISLFKVADILFVVSDKQIYLADADTGKQISSLDGNFAASAQMGDSVYLVRKNSEGFGIIHFGNKKNVESSNKFLKNATHIAVSKNIVFASNTRGLIYALKEDSKNKKIWSAKTGAAITGLDIYEAGVLATSLDNFVYFFSAKNGDLIWKRRFPTRISQKPQIIGEVGFIAPLNYARAFLFDLNRGSILNQISLEENEFIDGEPLITDKFILLPTNAGVRIFSQGECK